jgi:DNA-binding GntR family transcriptional regulator
MPNERLRLDALRQRYRVGGTPIREALMRLEAEGLVALEQNKGFRVAGVSRDRLLDLTRCRMEIESLALRWSIERGEVEWEANLLSTFHRLSRQNKFSARGKQAINPDWSLLHRAFHLALVAGCQSPTLLTLREGLFEQAERYVALSIAYNTIFRDDVAEHEHIMRTALARNVPRATKLIREHIERTAEKVAKSLDSLKTEPKLMTNDRIGK